MTNDLENYYLDKKEPIKSCLLALRSIITAHDVNITNAWKYRMPFFCYKEKMFCYLWVDTKTGEPYIGIVEGGRIEHPLLEQGNRMRMKILRINPNKDLPIKTIKQILNQALEFYRNGTIKLKKK